MECLLKEDIYQLFFFSDAVREQIKEQVSTKYFGLWMKTQINITFTTCLIILLKYVKSLQDKNTKFFPISLTF